MKGNKSMRLRPFEDYKTIKTTESIYSKHGNRWKLINTDKYLSSENEHKRCTNESTLRCFRSAGGREKNVYAYTKRGYVPVRNVSISPDGSKKIVRDYDFRGSEKIYDRARENFLRAYDKKYSLNKRGAK